MASKKTTKAPVTPKAPDQNTSAPASPGNPADVSGSGAAPAAPNAPTLETGTGSLPSSETTGTPTTGDASASGTKNEGDGEKKNEVKALIVSAKVEGFRRAGRPWSKTAETVPIEDFTEEQVKALLAEPMLDVQVVSE